MQALAQLGLVPGERLQLRPDLGVARSEVLIDEGHRGAPLLDEGLLRFVHRALALEDARGEPLQRLQQQLVDRAEVVVHEAMVLACLAGKLTRRDARGALPYKQPLGGIEECLDVGLPDRWEANGGGQIFG